MVLLIGGAYQGKTAYAQKKYGLRAAEILNCETELQDLSDHCQQHLERFTFSGREKSLKTN